MSDKPIHITSKRMIQLIENLKAAGTIKNRQEFLDVIGLEKQNYRTIVSGVRGFTVDQITKAIIEYKVNANWIFGVEKDIIQGK